MIQRPTVLVLGAGASADYGFFLGAELRKKITTWLLSEVKKTNSQQDPTSLFGILYQLDFRREAISRFALSLDQCGLPSVDLFLNQREDLRQIGTAAMAAALMRLENPGLVNRGNSPSRWYEHLWDRLLDDTRAESFLARNDLKIITFNYDRSLEHFLYNAVTHTFALSDAAPDVAEGLIGKILHVHGSFGEYPLGKSGGLPYEMAPSITQVELAAKRLRLASDVDDDSFATARGWLEKATTVCFLGFGFHLHNLRKLGIDGSNPKFLNGKRVFASGHSLPEGQRRMVESAFLGVGTNPDLGPPQMNCLDYLLHSGALFA